MPLKHILIFLAIYLSIIPILSWENDFYEKPQYVTYKFPDEKLPRHSFTRFPQAGVMISSFCIYKSGSGRKGRECGAWKPYEYIKTGKLVPLIREKGFFSKGDSPKQIAFLVCSESGGTVETEANEYNPNGREIELEDFCSFKDGSMTSFNFILLYIARRGQNIRTEIEKVKQERLKLLPSPPAKTN
ncbi:MAG TPA: hypothetical protein PK079_01675 [Leptospiraceae bacterium]|nr:hypothetical protein [Leptospiraceae bacterium]HMW04776.1 hypothetical protein [Leptospiraceae bacterium]HMX32793.1 hypothetical protein [Leptospiraceae bacterium]HMY33050.1 hypothetical protein [Leptospiraceae bacterium]HMZ65529.1 hypothetical protein [Leptospiraceae bacterium]